MLIGVEVCFPRRVAFGLFLTVATVYTLHGRYNTALRGMHRAFNHSQKLFRFVSLYKGR